MTYKPRRFDIQVKQVNDDGSVRYRLTSKKVDRHGEVVIPDGVNLDNFKENPIVLFCHGYGSQQGNVPIGKVKPDSFKVTSTYIDADVIFDENGKDPFAEMIGDKVRNGFLNAGSIGFNPIVIGSEPVLPKQTGVTILEWELYEFSVAPIPSNTDALAKREFAEFRLACKSVMDKPEEFDELLTEFYTKQDNEQALNELIIHKEFDEFRKNKLDEQKLNQRKKDIKTATEIAFDIKSGRVLSSKNRTLVKSVADNMRGLLSELDILLEATEPKGNDEDEKINEEKKVNIKPILESLNISNLQNELNKLKTI